MSDLEITSAIALSGTLLDGGFTPDQIKKRCKAWDVPYKAHGSDYWFRTSDFMKAFHEKEFTSNTEQASTRKKKSKKELAEARVVKAEKAAKKARLAAEADASNTAAKEAAVKAETKAKKARADNDALGKS